MVVLVKELVMCQQQCSFPPSLSPSFTSLLIVSGVMASKTSWIAKLVRFPGWCDTYLYWRGHVSSCHNHHNCSWIAKHTKTIFWKPTIIQQTLVSDQIVFVVVFVVPGSEHKDMELSIDINPLLLLGISSNFVISCIWKRKKTMGLMLSKMVPVSLTTIIETVKRMATGQALWISTILLDQVQLLHWHLWYKN